MPHFTPKKAHNVVCGFVPSVLSCASVQALATARAAANEPPKNRADINNICIVPKPKPSTGIGLFGRRTKNRKYVTHSDTLHHGGTAYRVNATKSGIYAGILHRTLEQLDSCLDRWGRVLVVRFDLHHKGIQTHSNKWLSTFIKNLKRRVERAYGLPDMGFIWVREQERGKTQHYHMAIFLDGDVVRHPASLADRVTATWSSINPVNTVYYPANSYYLVDSEPVKHEVVYRLSYLAKARGKGYRANQVKDFQCSRLAIKGAK